MMNLIPKRVARVLSYFLMVVVLLAGPMGARDAHAFPGVASLTAGTVAGGAAGIATGALIGALGLGTAAFALPTLGLIGAAIGGIVTAMIGNDDGASTPKAIAMGAGGAALGAGALAAGGFLFTPWVLIPAAAIGVGALAWKYMSRPQQWGGPGDSRYNGSFSSSFFSSNQRLANTSQTGYYGEPTALDKLRGIFDRNRRDDNFLSGAQVNPDGTLRNRNDLFASIGRFFSGTTNTGAYGGGSSYYGPGYGNTGYFSPGALPRTDRVGQVTVGGTGRSGFASSPGASADLIEAEAARDAAYEAMVEAMQSSADAEVEAAMESYRKASESFTTLRDQ